jgi:hypothetical protein
LVALRSPLRSSKLIAQGQREWRAKMGLSSAAQVKHLGRTAAAGRRRNLGVLVVAGVAALALATPRMAEAMPPASTVVTVDTSFTNTFDCAFPLQETVSGTVKDIVYFDGDGNVSRELVTAQHGGPLTVSWTNPANGVTLSSREASPLMINYNPDGSFQSLQNVGLTFNVVIPGGGTVMLDVGQLVITRGQGITFSAGPHQEQLGDTAAFCSAFS